MLQLKMGFERPLAWDALSGFLGARATPGVEYVSREQYARTVAIGGRCGVIRASLGGPSTSALLIEASPDLAPALPEVCAKLRHLFDLDAKPRVIERALTNAGLGGITPIVPGVRVPGAIDGFELALRAILGQQVSVRGATTLMARLVDRFGAHIRSPMAELSRLAPTADRLAAARVVTIRDIGLPTARAEALRRVAAAVASGDLRIEPGSEPHEVTRQLTELKGIGPWTAEYIAMRGVHWSDAFPASDLVLRRSAGNLTASQLARVADAWRPWRAYAAMQLWLGSKNAGSRSANDPSPTRRKRGA